jgi:EAL domain-containing protein (putative c-di-GMP-specific phosphodiesterase class I)
MSKPVPPAWLDEINAGIFPSVPLSLGRDGYVARFRGGVLSSLFQPVVDAHRETIVGYGARVRCTRVDEPVPAAAVFALTGPDDLVVQLDRAARTLHALNFHRTAGAGVRRRLFLRVQPRLIESVGSGHGRVFEGILGRLGVSTRDVVIEIPRHVNEDPALTVRAMLSYRSLGYRVSLELFDPQDPLLTPRYEVMPDIVSFDHRWVPDAATLRGIAARILDRGAGVFVKRIEDEQSARIAVDAGADLLQGWHFGRQQPEPCEPELMTA